MMSSGQCLIRVPIAIALVSLLACTPVATKAPVPSAVPPPSAGVTPPAPSAASAAAQQHYARVQANLLARGLMRTDGGTVDAPFTDRMLADNFIRVALYDEYTRSDRGLVAQAVQSRLRRWDVPIRVAVRFGASVPPERQATDRARIGSFLDRLQTISGHPIRLSDVQTNFFV